jgi:hypothetical protein
VPGCCTAVLTVPALLAQLCSAAVNSQLHVPRVLKRKCQNTSCCSAVSAGAARAREVWGVWELRAQERCEELRVLAKRKVAPLAAGDGPVHEGAAHEGVCHGAHLLRGELLGAGDVNLEAVVAVVGVLWERYKQGAGSRGADGAE